MQERDDWKLTDALHHAQGRGDPFAAAVRATRMPMIITDPRQDDNPIVFANEAFQKLTGYSREEVVGRNCRFLQGPDTDRDTIARIRKAISEEEDIAAELLNYRKDGTAFWNALFLSPVRSDSGKVQFFFASQLDVTSRIDAHFRLSRQRDEIEGEVRKRTDALKAALAAQTHLLHEVDHRVKNNMTMIGAILRLQLRHITDGKATPHLEDAIKRIDALGAVHRRLYQADDVTRFDIGSYAASLAADLTQGHGWRLITDLQDANISGDQAAALGVMINETLMTILRRTGHLGGEKRLSITAQTTDGRVTLQIEHSLAFAASADPDHDDLARSLITRLGQQVGARVSTQELTSGGRTTFSIGSAE